MGTIKTGMLVAATALALAGCKKEEPPVANNAADNVANAVENLANAADNVAGAASAMVNASNNANAAAGNESDPNANPIKP